jgi:hypothetical protein
MDNLEKDYEDLPLYKKAEEIFNIVREIAALVPEENEQLQFMVSQMLTDAMIIPTKIAGAEGGDLYSIRMENAAIIRKAANDLLVVEHSFKMFGFDYVEYFYLVRDRIEEFRLLFIEWVESFDKWNYIIDRWGLFNPPGVGPHDHDPDDDIPWDRSELDD